MKDHSPSTDSVQQLRLQADGPGPTVPAHSRSRIVPRFAEACGVGRAHLGPVRIPPVEFGLDQRPDVDAVDRQVHDLAVDIDVAKLDAAHHDPGQVRAAQARTGQVDGPQSCAPVRSVRSNRRATQISTNEISHIATLAAGTDSPAAAG